MHRYDIDQIEDEVFMTPISDGDYVRYEDAMAAIAAEREACAKVCDIGKLEAWKVLVGEDGIELCNSLAAAIRARSNTP